MPVIGLVAVEVVLDGFAGGGGVVLLEEVKEEQLAPTAVASWASVIVAIQPGTNAPGTHRPGPPMPAPGMPQFAASV